jgi:hypothetical protein
VLAFGALAVFYGGVIAGWLPQVRLAMLLRVEVDGVVLEPPSLAAARWMLAQHGPGNFVGTDVSNAGTLLTYGQQYVLAGRYPNILSILETETLADWQWETLRTLNINYMVIDRRKNSAEPMLNHFFERRHDEQAAGEWLRPQVYAKFDTIPLISRELDSGDIIIYNFKELLHAAAQR